MLTCIWHKMSPVSISRLQRTYKTTLPGVPPLSALSDGDLAGPETISLDEIDAEFAALEEERTVEQLGDPDRKCWVAPVYDFTESSRVDEGIVPRAIDDEITVVGT